MADTAPLFYGMAMGQNASGGVPLTYAQAQTQLQSILKYDPNAKLVDTGQQGSQGTGMGQMNPDGTMNYDMFTIDYDKSKLPAPAANGLKGDLVNFDPTDKTFGSTSQFGGHQWLSDPSQVFNDPNYGWLTPSSNYHSMYTGTSGDKTNDMIGGAIMSMATGIMGGGIGSALGGGLGGALGTGAFNVGMGELLSGGKMTPVQMLLAMASSAGSQVPGGGILSSLYKLFQYSQGGKHG